MKILLGYPFHVCVFTNKLTHYRQSSLTKTICKTAASCSFMMGLSSCCSGPLLMAFIALFLAIADCLLKVKTHEAQNISVIAVLMSF